jgi:hypothetical protein
MLSLNQVLVNNAIRSPDFNPVHIHWVTNNTQPAGPIKINNHVAFGIRLGFQNICRMKVAMSVAVLVESGYVRFEGSHIVLGHCDFIERAPFVRTQPIHDNHKPSTGERLETEKLWCKPKLSTTHVSLG